MVSIVIKSLGVATLSTLAAFLQGCDTIDAIDGILSDAVNGDDEKKEIGDVESGDVEAMDAYLKDHDFEPLKDQDGDGELTMEDYSAWLEKFQAAIKMWVKISGNKEQKAELYEKIKPYAEAKIEDENENRDAMINMLKEKLIENQDLNQELDDTDVTPAEASTETNALRSGVLSAGN